MINEILNLDDEEQRILSSIARKNNTDGDCVQIHKEGHTIFVVALPLENGSGFGGAIFVGRTRLRA